MNWNMVEALGTWFGGIATALAFFLGFTILLSDRMKAERAQADKVAIFSQLLWEMAHEDYGKQIDVRVWNHSDQPIFDAALWGIERDAGMNFKVHTHMPDQPDGLILPGEFAKMYFKNMDHIDGERLYVTFSDANRIDWKYRLSNRKLSKLKYRSRPVRLSTKPRASVLPKLD